MSHARCARRKEISLLLPLLAVTWATLPAEAHAYIGPGAGFAFLGSGLVVIVTIVMAIATILLLPFRFLIRALMARKRRGTRKAKRLIIMGLDGLDPKLAEKWMSEGKLPNLSKLKASGAYARLGTTLPALSPVAWSSFQTGVNPGAHNIFDFLTRDKRTCMPELSSTRTGKKKIELLRRSEPFWKILGRFGVVSNVIRVPISYPPEKFNGNVLSGMCTPDLRGSQGTFTLYTTQSQSSSTEGGRVLQFTHSGETYSGSIEGPPGFHAPFLLTATNLSVQGQRIKLIEGKFSDWTKVSFKISRFKSISGIVRFCLRKSSPPELYISPVNVDPEKPALPIASPILFASWLAKLQGSYGTLGLMEDTWGRNELALDDTRFLEQSYLTHDERERMFFETLDRTKDGVCIGVFDASDRIQHMFWRYLDPKHRSPCEPGMGNTIEEMYKKMDLLVGKLLDQLKPDDLTFVMSDHGFSSFRRCINLNTWLYENGYLALKTSEPTGLDYLQEVDWSKTRAFALGLTGLYVNRKGRERQGIVPEQQSKVLLHEIKTKLEGLKDPEDGLPCIKRAYLATENYKGLYVDEAPDLILGYAPGYRVSWDCVTGIVEKSVFSDNLKAWSGDHHVDPSEVPGVLFCNRALELKNPSILDLAPTALSVFGVKAPSYMEGKDLCSAEVARN